PTPTWASLVQAVLPLVDLILGASGALLSLWEMLRILTGRQDFDAGDMGQQLGLDDASELLSRIRPGCLVRVAIPAALFGGIIALLLSLLPLPGVDRLVILNAARPQSCAVTLAPFTFELDNSASTATVAWSAVPVEAIGAGTPWASLAPARGTLAPGRTRT